MDWPCTALHLSRNVSRWSICDLVVGQAAVPANLFPLALMLVEALHRPDRATKELRLVARRTVELRVPKVVPPGRVVVVVGNLAAGLFLLPSRASTRRLAAASGEASRVAALTISDLPSRTSDHRSSAAVGQAARVVANRNRCFGGKAVGQLRYYGALAPCRHPGGVTLWA